MLLGNRLVLAIVLLTLIVLCVPRGRELVYDLSIVLQLVIFPWVWSRLGRSYWKGVLLWLNRLD